MDIKWNRLVFKNHNWCYDIMTRVFLVVINAIFFVTAAYIHTLDIDIALKEVAIGFTMIFLYASVGVIFSRQFIWD